MATFRTTVHAARAALPLFALLAATGCATMKPVTSSPDGGLAPGGHVLTQSDIRQLGARHAMEALERSPSHLNIQRVRNGDPVRITQRGVGTFYLSPEVLVVVDGARIKYPVPYLEGIRTESIRYIQILNAREAAMKWGSEGGNGVIMILTSARP